MDNCVFLTFINLAQDYFLSFYENTELWGRRNMLNMRSTDKVLCS